MNKEQRSQEQPGQEGGGQSAQGQQQGQQQNQQQDTSATTDVDGLANKKPEELTPEELRLMADTMPGEGPGD